MAVVTLSTIAKSFGHREVLRDVSFHINRGERVALIGANGSGKTTLLRIICGEETADAGSVSKEPGITIGYLPQEVDLPEIASLHLAVTGVTPELLECACELAALEKRMAGASGQEAQALGGRFAEISHRFDTLHGFDYQIQAKAILLGLGFAEAELEKPVRVLSGGQKSRAALARLLLLAPDLLLLDEPTNHLDIAACEWLREFLETRYSGAALVVSHDRYFLDQVVSKVVEIENGSAAAYKGNYSAFAAQKAANIEEQRKLHKEQKKEIARIEAAIQTLFSDRKFSRRDSKVKQLERIERVAVAHERQAMKAGLAPAVRSGREVVRLHDLAKSYPAKKLFSGVDFTVERGHKIGVVGPNGSGKTTLLKIIAGVETADSGEVLLGHNVRPVYFAQEFDHLVPGRTVLEEMLADVDLSAKEARDLLARFLFTGNDTFKKVEVLSGGEMCRLALAKILAAGPNLLLLDEPTNHLDIQSREALEEALSGFDGTIIAASHDRYLLDALAGEIIEIADGRFASYLGNYSRYREKTHGNQTAHESPTPSPAKERPVSRLREMEARLRELSKRRRELEREIEQAEEHARRITAALGDEENYRNGSARELSREYDEVTSRLHADYAEWDSVCEQIKAHEEALSGETSSP